jgi:site-specific DNA recombinase
MMQQAFELMAGGLHNQKEILGILTIFPKKFQFENNRVRTADLNPILLKIASINKGLACKNKKGQIKKIDLSCMVGDEGFEPPTLWV